jgi:hypothetical protein
VLAVRLFPIKYTESDFSAALKPAGKQKKNKRAAIEKQRGRGFMRTNVIGIPKVVNSSINGLIAYCEVIHNT